MSLQLPPTEVLLTSEARKTRRGWLGRKIRETHLREDIPCGFELCPHHGAFSKVFPDDELSESTIYFLDSYTLIHQTDIIYNCPQLTNLIVLQSSVQKLRNYTPLEHEIGRKNKNINIGKYNAFKNYVETMEIGERRVFVLADLYHRGIRSGRSGEMENEDEHLMRCVKWYEGHCKEFGLRGVSFKVLTADPTLATTERKKDVTYLVDFLRDNNSNLLDFMGFELRQDIFPHRIFPEHMPLNEAVALVKQGKLFEGKFMNDKSYIKLAGTTKNIILRNNRAMFGDTVIIDFSPRNEWSNNTPINLAQEEPTTDFEPKDTTTITNLPNNSNSDLLTYFSEHPCVQPCGSVVAIYKRIQKNYCGSVVTDKIVYSNEMEDESVEGQTLSYQIHEFVPVDDKYPNFYIRTYQIDHLKNKRIMIAFDNWPNNSEHPLGHFIKIIGEIGDNRTESDVILLEHNVEIKEFSQKAYECLPSSGNEFIIPINELENRLDLRQVDVMSVDPPNCKDIDDALHCIELGNNHLEIGVHIADVSYYVRSDTSLDMEARNRCTTVYLVDRRTDMLPKLLTENLCSLRANVDRLAFSTIWEIDRNGNILNTKYCRSIIRSRQAFTYQQAQELIDSSSTNSLATSLRNLNQIAKLLKQKRNANGALTLASTQVKITLEEETHTATDVQLYQLLDTNSMIEEFMLLSNIAVANKIYERFPALSILRRHSQPKQPELRALQTVLNKYGYTLNFETSKQLANSLDTIKREDDPFFNKLIRIFTTRCMNEANYFCSADYDVGEFFHYGLAAPFYTHFTSPIRRYADVLVHRLLAAAIDLEPLPNFMSNYFMIELTKEK